MNNRRSQGISLGRIASGIWQKEISYHDVSNNFWLRLSFNHIRLWLLSPDFTFAVDTLQIFFYLLKTRTENVHKECSGAP